MTKRERIIELDRKGLTSAQIAERVGVTRTYVTTVLWENKRRGNAQDTNG